MNYAKEARKLADYIAGIENFQFYNIGVNTQYEHIGALFTDIILQSGLNYNSVVKPRVEHLLFNYPSCRTVSEFIKLIEYEGLHKIINWSDVVKLNRIIALLNFALEHNIDTCQDFYLYLQREANRHELLKLNGIGAKTIDYTMKLLNFDVVAVDRHIYSFVEMANIYVQDYYPVKKIVEYAADLLDVSRKSLDYSIWKHMSEKQYLFSEKAQLKLELT